ncbi:hypothetical protein UFOVP221_115 [uncultured Caudovirales phage]|uniref:Helix-turn-helix domain containing protein n=1 Tax=uncultured Caudovirales phage TaxID=2100421 RepID=A0A6J7WUB1_9CAUD|nr:hypothetical protein UFOVP221_115 [uncultured Caudovirales phage]
MQLPSEFFSSELTPTEFRIVIGMYHLSNSTGKVEVTMDELTLLTGFGREAIRRAIRKVEGLGLLETTRTKRNLGKYHKNTYQFLLPCLQPEASTEEPSLSPEASELPPCLPPEASTAGEVTGGTSTTVVTSNTSTRNTSYFLVRASGATREEIVVPRWNPDEDEGLAGVGLFDDDVQKDAPKADKRDSKTRNRRPRAEWTPNDVATEFSQRLGRKLPYTAGMVNVGKIRGALASYRKNYRTNADIEIALMDMFFDDERILQTVDKDPSKAPTIYLGMFKSHLSKALEQLGHSTEASPVDDDTPEFVYASDGRRFDNTIVGRKLIERHEQRLKGTE